MPTVTYNIDRILERVPEQTREAIRDALDEIQTIVYCQNCIQTQKITSTGMPPYLATTVDVYEYDCPADCRETEAIFCIRTSSIRSDIGRLVEPYGTYLYNNKEYIKVPIMTRSASISAVAKIYFKNNPGTTATTYFHSYYIKPTAISSEEIQLTIPEEKHWLLRKAVVALFTTEGYGESQYDEQIIERVARKIRNSLNRGFQSNVGITPVQEEYRDDTSRSYGYRQ
jgi:hypothetical protein